MPTDHGKQTIAAAEVHRFERDQPNVDRSCRYFTTSMAISAVQSCVFKALAEVPTKVFTRSDCFKARNN
jgi:hypothetical protein